MSPFKRRSPISPFTFFGLVLSGCWVAFMAGSFAYVVSASWDQMTTLATTKARERYKMDLILRKWSAIQGGVYAPVSDSLPPNPYLKVAEREIGTPSGRNLTLVNPAYMTRQIHELAEKDFGLSANLTSLKPIRPQNAPNPWERKALLELERGSPEFVEVIKSTAAHEVRFMGPLITQTACLKCHGDQGYKVGDIRGGIRMTVDLAPYRALHARNVRSMAATFGASGLFGVLIILLSSHNLARLHRGEREARVAAESNLTSKTRLLREKEQAIHQAAAVQHRLTTRDLPTHPLISLAACSLPSEELGGDFFDARKVGDRFVLVMGDCTGHGLGASLMAALLRAISDRHIGTLGGGHPAAFLQQVNRDITGYLWEGEFPVMFAAALDPDGTLRYANGNHPLPVVLRDGNPVDLPPVPGMHLGYDPEWVFEEGTRKLVAGDRVVFFSDAPIEVLRGDHSLDRHGFSAILGDLPGDPSTALDSLLRKLESRVGGFPLSDDLSIVIADMSRASTLEWHLENPGDLVDRRGEFLESLHLARWEPGERDRMWLQIRNMIDGSFVHRSPLSPLSFTLRLWIDGEKIILSAEGPALRISETVARMRPKTLLGWS